MFEGWKNNRVKKKVQGEKRSFLRNHEASADVTERDAEIWNNALQKDVFEKALARMRVHVGRAVEEYVTKYPDRSVSEVCRLVFNNNAEDINRGIGNLIPEGAHRVVRIHIENMLIAELVTMTRIRILLQNNK